MRVRNPELLSTPGPAGLLNAQFLVASFLAILMIPVTQPQLSTRLVIIKSTRKMHQMAVAVGTFAMLVIFPTIIIGLYGAINYPDANVSDFIGSVLLNDQAGVVAAASIKGLFAAAMSTSDSQLFALGNELRGLMGKKENTSLMPTKIASVSFAISALIFSLVSSDQLVLLARMSFDGTAMMGPLVILAIVSKKLQGWFMILMSGIGLGFYILSEAGIIQNTVENIRMDLFLMIVLAIAGIGIYLMNRLSFN